MSWQASGWAKKCRTASPTHKLVLLIVADYATDKAGAIGITVPDGHAVSWAGIDEIALDCDMSPRTVIRVLADLQRDDFIRRDRRYVRNPRYGQCDQPQMIRTTDAIWIDYSRAYVTSRPDEARHAAKVRAGRAGGRVSAKVRADRRAALDAQMKAAADSLNPPPGPPPDPAEGGSLTCHPASALDDILLGAQVTPSFTAEPTGNLQITDRDSVALSATDRACEAPEKDHPSQLVETPAGTAPSSRAPRPAGGARHRNRRPRRAWVNDGTGSEPARYRRPPLHTGSTQA